MNYSKKAVLVLIAIVFFVALFSIKKILPGGEVKNIPDSNVSGTKAVPTQIQSSGQSSDDLTSGMSVKISPSGFEPSQIKIKRGSKVTWLNESGSVVSIASDPHPTHTNYPPLNLGILENGTSVSLVFDSSGNYGYHDHLNPAHKGTVIVE